MNCANCGQELKPDSQFCDHCGRHSLRNIAMPVDVDGPTFVPLRSRDLLEGKWRLERKIGEGGMGTVYLAHDLQLDRPVAIKVLSNVYIDDAEVLGRFEREARMTAGLEHPNIVPIYAVGRFDGRPFMVMKKLDGHTLAEHLRVKGHMSIDEMLALMRQICSGLDFIHSRGFVHRDIKTGNIFVGPDGHATILDFGILRPSKSNEALTRHGMVMGTPQYMSPEQALGVRDVDHRADLYALAVVLFECLSGTLPFEADTELKLVQLQAYATPPDIMERASWITRSIADVVKRALAKKPEDRYASAGELLLALETAHQPILSSSSSPHIKHCAESGELQHRPAPLDQRTAPSLRRLAEVQSNPSLSAAKSHRGRWLIAAGIAAAIAVGAFASRYISSGTDSKTDSEATNTDALAFTSIDAGAAERQTAMPSEQIVAETDESPKETEQKLSTKRKVVRRGIGSLKVITTHNGDPYWAQVLVDGVLRGRTPLEFELPAGRHTIRVERTGFRLQERQIFVAQGRSAVLRIALVP